MKNGQRRVVITGVGAVTPIGTGADGLWAGLAARTSAVREITRFDPAPFRSRIAAEIPDFGRKTTSMRSGPSDSTASPSWR